MLSESAGKFYTAFAAVTVYVLTGVSGLPPRDNVIVEVKLEKELHLISKNSSVNENDKVTQPFHCVINGLNEDELSLFSLRKSQNVIVSTKAGNLSRFDQDNLKDEGSQTEPLNVEFEVVNDTLLVTGEVLMMRKSNDSDLENGNLQKAITNCEVVFLETEEDDKGGELRENVTSRHSERSPPIIATQYDYVVMMNGAPEQVISCAANGNPLPQIRWILQSKNGSNAEVLTRELRDSKFKGEIVSYLLFPLVDKSTTGNYTCVAENQHGRVSKTFEVEVISVEAINPRCNVVTEGPPTSRNQKIIFKQNIHDILRRSKRHLWYQWRTTKIDVPPNDPYSPLSSDDGNSGDLQKIVNLIAERLNLADKVAVNKWDNNLPVEDIPREQIILDNVVRQAQNRGLDTDWAHRFFRNQIEANKVIQYELIRIWQIDGRRPPGPPVDLGNEVRPEIDYINGELIELAKLTEKERKEWGCRSEVEKNARYAAFVYDLDPLHQKTLQQALENICIAQNFRDEPPFPFHPYPPPSMEFSPY